MVDCATNSTSSATCLLLNGLTQSSKIGHILPFPTSWRFAELRDKSEVLHPAGFGNKAVSVVLKLCVSGSIPGSWKVTD